MGVCAGSKTGNNATNIPYSDWKDQGTKLLYFKDGNGEKTMYGVEEDETIYDYEPDIRKITKTEILREAGYLKNDDGTYGNEDYSIFASYEDGSTWDSFSDKKFKKSGLIGLSVQTPDEQMVWGEDWVGIGRNRHRVPMTTVATDDVPQELSNVRYGYKAVSAYKRRVRTTYYDPKTGKTGTKREIIKQSTVKKLEK